MGEDIKSNKTQMSFMYSMYSNRNDKKGYKFKEEEESVKKYKNVKDM